MSQLQKNAAARRIVVGSIVDIVPRHVGTYAQVIIVSGVQNGFILQFVIEAG